MQALPVTHPWIHNQLMTTPGLWTYQRQSGKGFNGMSADQAIETTVNKDSKTSGGVVGFSRNKGKYTVSFFGRFFKDSHEDFMDILSW